jgi:hypothetical protein
MNVPQKFWLEKRLTISCLISIPTVAMIASWIAMFLNPALGFSETLKPFFIVLLIASCLGSIAGIIFFFISTKTWPVIACFVISLASILLNVYGFLWSIGSVVAAFE